MTEPEDLQTFRYSGAWQIVQAIATPSTRIHGDNRSYDLTPEEALEVAKQNAAAGLQHLVDERNATIKDWSVRCKEQRKKVKNGNYGQKGKK